MDRNENLPKSRMDLHALPIPDPGCPRILNDEVYSVLQLVSRNQCHDYSVGLVGCSAYLTQTRAMRMR